MNSRVVNLFLKIAMGKVVSSPSCETQTKSFPLSSSSSSNNEFIIAETAGLLPARYFEQRYKQEYDVRQNLFEHQKKNKKNSKTKYSSNHWSMNSIEDGYQADQPYGGGAAKTSFEIEPDE